MKEQYKINNPDIVELNECIFHSQYKPIEGIHINVCSAECLNFKLSENHEECLNHFIDIEVTNDMKECCILADGTVHISFLAEHITSADKYIEYSLFGFQKHPIAPNDINGVVYTPYRLERGEYIP